jgi:hypothetical protein
MNQTMVYVLAAMAMGAVILALGYMAGREAGRNERDDRVLRDGLRRMDPDGKAGRLPSEDDEDDYPTQDIEEADTAGRHYRPEPVPADWVPPRWIELRQQLLAVGA